MPERAAAIIPARLAATRLPNKPLALLAGRPMIAHVYERAMRAQTIGRVLVATPDDEIMRAVRAFGGEAVLTSADHRTGTDRVAESARLVLGPEFAVIVNVQGDEPLLDPQTIDAVAAPLLAHADVVMASAMCALPPDRDADPAVVKVVCDRAGNALYFSRAAIPFRRHPAAAGAAPRQHVGLYAYRADFLQTLTGLAPTPLEQAESLEQLRVLEWGYRIRMVEITQTPESVDTPEDLARVRALLAAEEAAL